MTATAHHTAPATARTVGIGSQVVGGTRLPVLAGPRRGADIVHVSLRRHHGENGAEELLAAARDLTAGPILVEPFSADDLRTVVRYADGVVVGGASMQDFRLLSAVGRTGLPAVVHRGPYCTVEEWLSAVEYVRADGNDAIILCEGGTRTYASGRTTLDLALIAEVRERSGRPVIVDISATPALAAAAVAAGTDGVWLGEDADQAEVDAALAAASTLAPVVRQVRPRSLSGCREAIDRVDATLASLLEYRVRLVAEAQRHKPVAGHAGRDHRREAQIIRAMSRGAPSLGHGRLTRIMDAVITAGLDAAGETEEPPVWRL